MRPRVRRLVLAEKLSAARRLAQILSEGKTETVRAEVFIYFQFSRAVDNVIIFPPRGHVVEIDYPAEAHDWKETDLDLLIDMEPIRQESPPSLHDTLRRLADETDEVVLATDYDREGELIGVEALETLRSRRQDLPAWRAVLTRFLTLECASDRQILSAGRVQTPTLGLVAEREREREDFVPRPFWNVHLVCGTPPFEATAVGGPFWDPGAANAVVALSSLGGETATVERITRSEHREPPPAPFNTTSLLAKASREGISASRAMLAAQDLYVHGEISYPRTDNTVYPPPLPVPQILGRLHESAYGPYAERLLAQPSLEPSRGPIQTTDHPPVHPTAAPAKRRDSVRSRMYDLVARRFLATLSPASVTAVTEVRLTVGDSAFLATGRKILDPGWREILPEPETMTELPSLSEGEVVPIQEIRVVEDRTKSPPLHSQGSLLLAMQRLELGTKSTRHEILDLLFRRQFVTGRSMRTTAAGRALVDALAIYGPDIASPEMTRHLEERMTAIAEGQATLEDVVTESRRALHAVVAELRAHRTSLSRWIRDATFLEKDYGPCTVCPEGRLVRRRARNVWAFLGCSSYPAC